MLQPALFVPASSPRQAEQAKDPKDDGLRDAPLYHLRPLLGDAGVLVNHNPKFFQLCRRVIGQAPRTRDGVVAAQVYSGANAAVSDSAHCVSHRQVEAM